MQVGAHKRWRSASCTRWKSVRCTVARLRSQTFVFAFLMCPSAPLMIASTAILARCSSLALALEGLILIPASLATRTTAGVLLWGSRLRLGRPPSPSMATRAFVAPLLGLTSGSSWTWRVEQRLSTKDGPLSLLPPYLCPSAIPCGGNDC